MDFSQGLKIFILCLVVILILDGIWLGLIANKFYKRELGSLAKTMNGDFKPNLVAAIGVYLVMALGLTLLVFTSGVVGWQLVGKGALLGFVTYAVYELTNFAILNGWSLRIVGVDILWGVVLSSVTTLVVALVTKVF